MSRVRRGHSCQRNLDGTDVPTINNMLVEPSMVMNAIFTVTPGEVTVRAGAVKMQ